MSKIIAFAGSQRKDSWNKKLLHISAKGAKSVGAQVTVIDLANFPMPLFDPDLEAREGIPEKAKEFKKLLVEHDGFLIASPEYNSAFTPLLKNVLDWASLSEPDEGSLIAYKGKVATIMATSPGAGGGRRGLLFLRMLLQNLGMIVLPTQHAIPNAFQAFGEDGSLLDEKQHQSIMNLGINLAHTVEKLF